MDSIEALGTDEGLKLPAPLTVAFLRGILLREKEARLQKLAGEQSEAFSQVYYIVKHSPDGLERVGAGFRPDTGHDDPSRLDDIRRFRLKYDGADGLTELVQLDVSVCPPSPDAVLATLVPAGSHASLLLLNGDDKSSREQDKLDLATGTDVLMTDGDTSMDQTPLPTTAAPSPLSSTSTLPSSSLLVPVSAPTTNPPPSHISVPPLSPAPTPPVASTSQLPSVPTPSVTPVPPAPAEAGPSVPRPAPLPIPVPEIALDYVQSLPEVPEDLFRQRLVIKRRGKDKSAGANGGPDLYRLHVKAQHTGAKNFLGRGKRVHNVLSTADYSVAIEELRAIRAFDRIEQIKGEKKWSFRQPKKQRPGVVPKAHWDHLLDEMRWMQTDFRQETRWKVVTAYNLARAVKAWHRAGPEQRASLCVTVSPPNFLPANFDASGSSTPALALSTMAQRRMSKTSSLVEGERRNSTASEMDVDADGELDTEPERDAEGEAEVVGGEKGEDVKKEGDAVAAVAVDPKASPSKAAAANSQAEQAQRNKEASLAFQALILSRAPIFELGANETLIDSRTLLGLPTPASSPVSIDHLFPELPTYSILNPDSHDKRLDEACIFSGRLSNVSRHFDSKPLLVSTLQPSKTKKRDSWSATMSANLEDTKDTSDSHDLVPVTSQLFAGPGRKGKEVAKGKDSSLDPNSKATPLPNAELRATSLLWAPEEDALIVSLRQQYGSNWDLIADFFNGAIIRPATDFRLPWDCYDRWDRLVGPNSKKMLEDGTEVSVPLPEYVPIVDKGKGPQFSNFEGSKKRLRHLSVFDAMRKQQRKREATQKPPAGMPRRLNMNMHESHNLPQRPVFSPIEWSNLKLEQDRNKQEIARRVQLQQQQELAIQHQRLQQQQLQNGGARYQQVPPQGFPLQQGRVAGSLPLNISQQNQARLGLPGTPGSPLPLTAITSPRSSNASPPIQGVNGQYAAQYAQVPNLAALVQAQALANGNGGGQQLSPEQLVLLGQRQQQINQMQSQQAAMRAQQQQQAAMIAAQQQAAQMAASSQLQSAEE